MGRLRGKAKENRAGEFIAVHGNLGCLRMSWKSKEKPVIINAPGGHCANHSSDRTELDDEFFFCLRARAT
jgi:hypothetical protein